MAEENYTLKDIETIVKDMIAEQLSVKKEDITLEKSLVNDFGADSLDTAEFVINLEERFHLSISDEDVKKIRTVKDVIDYLVSKYDKGDKPY